MIASFIVIAGLCNSRMLKIVLGLNAQKINRGPQQIDQREHKQRLAPTDGIKQKLLKRNKSGAGKATPQSNRCDARTRIGRPHSACHHRKGRLVQTPRLQSPNHSAQQIKAD